MNLLEKTDLILRTLDQERNNFKGYSWLEEATGGTLDQKDIDRIVTKLVQQNLVERRQMNNSSVSSGEITKSEKPSFGITYDGMMLLEKYKSYGKYLDKDRINSRLKQAEAIFLVMGAIAAVVLAVIEVCNAI